MQTNVTMALESGLLKFTKGHASAPLPWGQISWFSCRGGGGTKIWSAVSSHGMMSHQENILDVSHSNWNVRSILIQDFV